MSDTTVRKPIVTQLDEFFAAAGIAHTSIHMTGRVVYGVDGRYYPAARAARRFLPGGYDGAFGQPGTLPRHRLGDTIAHAPNSGGATIDVTVVALYGAARYCDGYLALCLDATGSAHVLPA